MTPLDQKFQRGGWGGVGDSEVQTKPFSLPHMHDGIILPVVTQGDFVYWQ